MRKNISLTLCNNFATFVPASSRRPDFILTYRFNFSHCVLRQRTLVLIWLHLPGLRDTFLARATYRFSALWEDLVEFYSLKFFCGVTWNGVRKNIIITLVTFNPFRESLRKRVRISLWYQTPYYCSCACTDTESLSLLALGCEMAKASISRVFEIRRKLIIDLNHSVISYSFRTYNKTNRYCGWIEYSGFAPELVFKAPNDINLTLFKCHCVSLVRIKEHMSIQFPLFSWIFSTLI